MRGACGRHGGRTGAQTHFVLHALRVALQTGPGDRLNLSKGMEMRGQNSILRYSNALAGTLSTLALLAAAHGSAVAQGGASTAQPRETPASMVDALHAAFGEHHARAVHTKGVMFEGTFTPSPEARAITRASIFFDGSLPVVARFSLFAGVPDLPDNDDGAAPTGFAVKIKGPDGDDFDLELNQHSRFIVATFDEFAVFLRAVGASGPAVPHPNPVEQFLAAHPDAAAFLATRTYPASFAQATYFGVNSLKFTDGHGQSAFVRYRARPRAGERYLSIDQRKAMSATYLHDEIAERASREPIVFDWYAQVAESGDKIDDPSIAWPEDRRMVKLGTFTLTSTPSNPESAQRRLLFLPGKPHAGVEPADPMLVLRNSAYPISFAQRQ